MLPLSNIIWPFVNRTGTKLIIGMILLLVSALKLLRLPALLLVGNLDCLLINGGNMKPSRKSVLNAVKSITGHSDQLSLFPYSSEYAIACNSVIVCYRPTCFGCRYVDIRRKDYDYYTNPKKY